MTLKTRVKIVAGAGQMTDKVNVPLVASMWGKSVRPALALPGAVTGDTNCGGLNTAPSRFGKEDGGLYGVGNGMDPHGER